MTMKGKGICQHKLPLSLGQIKECFCWLTSREGGSEFWKIRQIGCALKSGVRLRRFRQAVRMWRVSTGRAGTCVIAVT